jgi:hypothetical protein
MALVVAVVHIIAFSVVCLDFKQFLDTKVCVRVRKDAGIMFSGYIFLIIRLMDLIDTRGHATFPMSSSASKLYFNSVVSCPGIFPNTT